MKAHIIDTHLVPRSRSSAKVKVKYQGHISQKIGVSGALVFHKDILVTMSLGRFTYKFVLKRFAFKSGCLFQENEGKEEEWWEKEILSSLEKMVEEEGNHQYC